ncbi:tRNA pseudouridine(38-40) synthase TruA [Acanthopleuribacter pedis]|uniref:tRNA pseudouridine synthase A n=1 Tax=Acanthopleuribacter pedis TaxID=442870 RepID=A0A8J7QC17_9BACT|nr:tRNA pseudouridine(38-40) synthase TruA [Acanthopleuribacter pedis]MBO1322876.1 tRNA pseudouridine(38-40) synthase TruA [Acanthopleuribacter pedis]
MRIAYNGARFHGWQIQPDVRTVQGEVAAVLARILKRETVKTVGSSRTDTGVHAHDQRVGFEVDIPIPLSGLRHALERLLPSDIQVLGLVERPPGFQARFHAQGKHYGYCILNPLGIGRLRAFQNLASPFVADLVSAWAQPLDTDTMHEAAQALVGTRCFKAMQSAKDQRPHSDTTIYKTRVRRKGALVFFEVVGKHFLYLMVRNMIGSLIQVGTGEWRVDQFVDYLNNGDRRLMGDTAPARGLHLFHVFYEKEALDFTADGDRFLEFLGSWQQTDAWSRGEGES